MPEQRYRFTEAHDRFRPTMGSISFIGKDGSLNVKFMYNPAEVVRRHGFGHGRAAIPGRSHPMYGGGAGDEETFSFSLQMDADRGNFERRKRTHPNGSDFEVFDALVQQDAANGGPQLSQLENLRPLLNEFFQLVKPEGLTNQPDGGYNVPARIFLDLGSIIQAEVGIDNLEEGTFSYGVRLNVMKANLRVQGHVIEHSNVTNTILVARNSQLTSDPTRVRDEQQNRVPGIVGG